MTNIDFSKAPDGATHYSSVSDKHISWWMCNMFGWSCYDNAMNAWVGVKAAMGGCAIEIPQQLTVTCDNERQKMLCEQVLRMCRGEASEYQYNDEWITLDGDSKNPLAVCVDYEYRAKPKKELAVPWEWLASDINKIMVNKNGDICHVHNDGYFSGYITTLKLDLTDIDLPVTVKRP